MHEHVCPRVKFEEVGKQGVNRRNHLVRRRRHAEPGQLLGIGRGRIERLVGHIEKRPVRGADRLDGAAGTGEERVAEIDRAVEIEDEAAVAIEQGHGPPPR